MPTPSPSPSSLLTPEQAASFLGVTAGTLNVWRATRRYPLPFCKIGRKVMYRQSDLETFAESRLHGGDSAGSAQPANRVKKAHASAGR